MVDSGERPRRFSLDWWTSLSGVLTAFGTVVAVAGLVVAIMALPGDGPVGPVQPAEPSASVGSVTPSPPIGSSPRVSQLAHTPTLGVSFWQHGVQMPMTDFSSGQKHGDFVTRVGVELAGEPFEIRFPEPAGPQIFRLNASRNTENFAIPTGTDAGDTVFAPAKRRVGPLRTNGILPLDPGAHDTLDSGTMDHSDNRTLSVWYSRFDDRAAVPRPTAFPDHVYEPTEATLVDVADWHRRVCLTIWQDMDDDLVLDDHEYEYLILVFPGTPGT